MSDEGVVYARADACEEHAEDASDRSLRNEMSQPVVETTISLTTMPPETSAEASVAFIVGCSRSGTTWLQRMLAEHPAVYTGQESHVFEWFIGPMLRKWHRMVAVYEGYDPSRRNGIGLGAYLTTEEFRDLLRPLIHRAMEPSGAGRGEVFLEKTPGHSMFVPEIVDMLPEARFIHLVRDPRDVVASLLRASKSWGQAWAPSSAKEAARQWLRHVSAVQRAKEELGKEQFFEIRYEDLHRAPAEVLSRLVGFLELEWAPSAIEESIKTNSPEKIRAGKATPLPVFGQLGKSVSLVRGEPSGFVGRARPGRGKDDLSLPQKLVVWRATRTLAREFGYEWSPKDFL